MKMNKAERIQEKINEYCYIKGLLNKELKKIDEQLEKFLFISKKELESLGFQHIKDLTYKRKSWYITLITRDYGRVLVSKNQEYTSEHGMDISFDSKEEFLKFLKNAGIIYYTSPREDYTELPDIELTPLDLSNITEKPLTEEEICGENFLRFFTMFPKTIATDPFQ